MDILVFRLNHTSSAELAELEKSCFSDPWTVGMFRDSFNDPLTRCFGASVGGKTVGFGMMMAVAGEGEILRIAVRPELRRGGIGRALMQAMVDAAAEEGLISMTLEVRASNIPATELYKAFGFEEIAIRKNYYEHPTEDARIMEKKLCSYSQ